MCERRSPEAASSSCSPVAAEHHGSTRILRTVARCTKPSQCNTPRNPFQGPVMPLNILVFPLILMRVLMQITTKNLRTDFLIQLLLICANDVALNQPAATRGGTSTRPVLAASCTSQSLLQRLGQTAFQMPSQGSDKLNAVTKFWGKKSHASALRGLPRSPDRVPEHALCTEQLTAQRFVQVFRVFAKNCTTLRLVNGKP